MQINNYDSVADLYDIYVPVDFDVQFFTTEVKQTSRDVLELMSGTGRVSIPLLEAGARLTCVDLSASSNAILQRKLQQRGLTADIHTMDICELDLHRQFDMILIPFHSFAHITSVEDQRRALSRIRQHMAPGGTFICTLGNPDVRQKAVNGQLRLARKYSLPDTHGMLLLWIVEKISDDDTHVVEAMQFYEEYDANGILQRKRLLEIHFRLTSRKEFETLAENAGFKIRSFYGDYQYSDFNDESPFMVWVLETTD